MYYAVMNAFGITGRKLVSTEIAYISRWTNEYGFDSDVIARHAKRTMASLHQPNFKYTDSILSDWNKKQVHHLSDIAKLDAAHQERKKSSASAAANTASRNKFNNFTQRSYDYDELEQMLTRTHTAKGKQMPLSNSQYDEIFSKYDEKQLASQHQLERHTKDVYARIPALKEIDDAIATCSVEQARRLLDGDEAALTTLREKLSDYRRQKEQLLQEHGLTSDYLKPVYHCPDLQGYRLCEPADAVTVLNRQHQSGLYPVQQEILA